MSFGRSSDCSRRNWYPFNSPYDLTLDPSMATRKHLLDTHTHTHTHTQMQSLQNALLVFHPRFFFFLTLRTPVSFVFAETDEIPTWGEQGKRRTKENMLELFFSLLSDLQGFSAAITQKCYQMLLAIVGPKKPRICTKSVLSFSIGETGNAFFPVFLNLMQFWNSHSGFFAKYLEVDEAQSA